MSKQQVTPGLKIHLFWDAQDPKNKGWAWSSWYDGEYDSSGPYDAADGLGKSADDEELFAGIPAEFAYALRKHGSVTVTIYRGEEPTTTRIVER